MLKVLLADDEKKEISFLLQTIDWADMGLEVVGVAENGQIADEMEQALQPDIVVTDILMPHTTGVELAERIRRRRKDVHIIFLTGHRSFEFAQEAIKSDVEYYLLKPIDPEQLKQVLTEVSQRCVDDKRKRLEEQLFQDMLRENMAALREAMLRQLLNGVPMEEQRLQFYNISLGEDPLCVAVLYALPDPEDSEYQRNLSNYQLNLAVQEIIGDKPHYLFFPLESAGKYAMILQQSSQETVVDLLLNVQRNVALMCRRKVSIGVGKTVHGLSDLPDSYQTALLALEHAFDAEAGELLLFNDLIEESSTISPLWLDGVKTQLGERVISGQTDKTKESLEYLSQRLKRLSLTVQVLHTMCIDLTNTVIWKVSTYYPTVIPSLFGQEVSFLPLMELTDTEKMVHWVGEILLPICEKIAERQLSRQGLLASQLKAYMDNNLEKDMTVESIAAVVSLSRGYASSIFKKKYGVGINQYLLNTRMIKAKELLAQPLLKIRDVAAMVGFYNNAHFSAVFKREVGVSPRDYRERILE